MGGKTIIKKAKKVAQKLKRPKEEWYFNVTPEMLQRFCYLLGLASAFDISESNSTYALLFGKYYEEHSGNGYRIDRETAWQKFQNEMDTKFGRITNDSSSTLATMDDNPGPGRLIDKFVYQPIGRTIERIFLDLEIRYFDPPEKSARRIKRFLEESVYFKYLIPADKIFDHDFYFDEQDFDTSQLKKKCVSFFLEISQREKVSKAFHRLLMQASLKNRGLRVEAQKQIWSLIRYKNMAFILNTITDLESLLWDGYSTTFQHCSPLDLDFQTHFSFAKQTLGRNDQVLLVMPTPPVGMMCISMRDILETCARGNRGFSSLPINLVFRLLDEEIHAYLDHKDQKLEDTEKFAENLYLASIAIIGFGNEFSYALDLLSDQWEAWYCRCYGGGDKPSVILPSMWGKDRTESDINVLELMAHFMINFISTVPFNQDEAEEELRYYMALLNDADKAQGKMSYLEARASEEYLRKVTEELVQRRSFAMFKDTVTNPLIWEKYYRPEGQTEATWNYELRIEDVSSDESQNPVPVCFYYIPFSDSFRSRDFDDLYFSLPGRSSLLRQPSYEKQRNGCFQIQKWLEELKDNSTELHWDRPGTDLSKVMKWWWSYDVQARIARRNQKIKEGPLWMELSDAIDGETSSDIMRSYPYQRRSSPKLEDERTPDFGNEGVSARSDSPCLCSICLRCTPWEDESLSTWDLEIFLSLAHSFEAGPAQTEVERVPASIEEHFLPHQTEDVLSQHRRQHNTATESSPLTSRPERLKRKFEEEEPRPQIAPLPRRYRDNTVEDAELGSLGPVRKKQRTSFSLESDTSDADSRITEVDEDSTKSDTGSEDAMSVDEDFWSAKSKLSLLAIED